MMSKLVATAVAGLMSAGGATAALTEYNPPLNSSRGMADVQTLVAWNYSVSSRIWTTRVSGRLYNHGYDHVYAQFHPDWWDYTTYAEQSGRKAGEGTVYAGIDARLTSDVRHVARVVGRACESAWGPDRCDSEHILANPHQHDQN